MAHEDAPSWLQESHDFIEQLGFHFETGGHQRIMGRVLGWLVVCEPCHQTAAELAHGLHVSRSAISPITQRLVQQRLLDRISFPGVREVYFRIADDGWTRIQREGLPGITAMRQLTEHMLERLGERDPSLNRRLKVLRDLHLFLEREMPALLDRWERECKENGR